MISWGVKVNEYGNADLDENGDFIKMPDQGVSPELWEEMAAYAQSKDLKGGNYKKLNLPFENKLLGLPAQFRERMTKGVEDFVYELLSKVFNAGDTAPLAIEALLEAGSCQMKPKAEPMEDPGEWTEEKIRERARAISSDKGPAGDFDD
jgi:hypothetical protein